MVVYTAQEVAEKLKSNVNIIRQKLKKGLIKGKKQDGNYLITHENFLEYTHGIEKPVLIKEFAKMVRKCEKTIRDKLITGELRGVKLGNWYVDYNEINKFV